MSTTEVARLGAWLDHVQKSWQGRDPTWSQKRFCHQIRTSPNNLRAWKDGERQTIQPSSLDSVAQGVGVSEGDIRRVMDGETVEIPGPPSRDLSVPVPLDEDADVTRRLRNVEDQLALVFRLISERP